MKKLLFFLLFLSSPLYAKELAVDITTTTTLGLGTVEARAKVVTFIFDSPCDIRIINIGNVFTGSPDVPFFTMTAPEGDVLGAINYTIGSGGMRIIREQ